MIHQQTATNRPERFEREFKKANIPFSDIIEKELRFKNELFDQYIIAETKFCFYF